MKLLVTGGAGFIGSNFVRYYLRHHPEDVIRIIDKLTYAGNLKNITWHSLDILGEDICHKEIEYFIYDFDAVVHFAAESHVDRSIDDGTPFIKTNVEGTWNLIEACRKAKVKRFIHISTDEVYGSIESGKATESSPLNPTSPYAASKAASDLLVLSAIKTHNFPAIITRCTNNYGPYQFPEKAIPIWISRAQAGQDLPIHGDGKHVRDWIHVDDHCSAIDAVLQKGRVGQIYNIAGGNEMQSKDTAKMIYWRLFTGEKWANNYLQYIPDRPANDRRYAIDDSKIKNELGWKPIVKFETGLQRTIQWYLQNKEWMEDLRQPEALLR